jgi:hypothetical protein
MSSTDPYLYDVFVSYPQRGGLPDWVAKVLKPLLEEKLDEAGIDEKPRIFVDTKSLQDGIDWPDDLSEAHARSRVIVPVLCAPYFRSGWCTSEWTNAFEREARERQRSGTSLSLVLPLRYNDLSNDTISQLEDEAIREQVRKRTRRDVSEFSCLVNPKADIEAALKFRRDIEHFCEESLLPAIKKAPAWRPDWPRLPKKAILGSDPSWVTRM